MSGYYNQGPPQGAPYQQSHSPYPPPHGGPPPQGYQQGWNQPPPPPGNYGPPGGAPYPPPGAPYGAPPPGQYGAPPPGNYGAPHGGYAPPPGQYGGLGYGAPAPPAPPSLGYVPGQQANMDMSRAADDLRSAMKGFGTNETQLIRVLASLDPLQINSVKAAFHARHKRDLMKDVHSETSGNFREGLEGILRGPLDQDCHELHEAIAGLGTKESALNEVLLARSNADMHAIKQHYHQKYRRTLEADVRGDLSMKTERLFDMVLAARRNEESAPVIPQQTEADVEQFYRATEGRTGADQIAVCTILTSRSNAQIRALAQAYRHKYTRSLDEVIRKEFSGHMEDALLYIVHVAEDPAKHDADLMEDAMRGMGTKDRALIRRIIAVHWDKARLQQCKAAYRHFHKRELAQRLQGELSGDYEKLMVACIT